MDLSWLQYLRDGIGLAGLCALLIVALVLRQQPRVKAESQGTTATPGTPSSTNGKASKDYVEARIYQHEVNCSRAEEILKRLDRMEVKLDKVLGGGR